MNTTSVDTDVVAAMFEDRAAAEAARDTLVADGVDHGAIDIVDQATGHHGTDTDDHARSHGIWRRLRDMLVPHEHAHGYAEGIERGHATLFVRAAAERQSEVMAILERQHPIDVMHRVNEWTESGWSGVHRSQAAAAPLPMLFQDSDAPDHMRSTGLLNEGSGGRGIGAPLLNPMGIEVPGTRVTGTARVRRYEADPDALPVDDI